MEQLPAVPEQDPLEPSDDFNARELVKTQRLYLQNIPYDPRVAALVVARVAEGELLKKIMDEYQISGRSILNWKRRHPEFKDALESAEKQGARFFMEEAVELSDGDVSSMMDAAKMKLQIDVRQKLAAKHDPERYGDRQNEGGETDLGKILDQMKAGRQSLPETTTETPI